MDEGEKSKHMFTWWEENLKIFSQMALRREDFAKIVLESRLLFRDGIQELLATTFSLNIPMLIVSGGISEIIEGSFCTIMADHEVESDAAKAQWESLDILSNAFHYYEDQT
jgi:2-hydroxy-3-keto-5-methylthiopentenyl-1-phosphate phosphatase